MKKILSLCGLALLLIYWGCGTKEEPAPGNQPTTQEKMQKKLTEGAQAAKDYLASKRKNMERTWKTSWPNSTRKFLN